MNMYENAKIYRILDSDTDAVLLVGSTTGRLSQKMSELKYNYLNNRSVKKYKVVNDRLANDKIYIELVLSYPCKNIEELR